MIQLYLLSVVLNSFCGYVLIMQEGWENNSVEGNLKFSPQNEIFRLILGIITALVGLLKLLSPVGLSPFSEHQKVIPILGDLVPAACGIAAGFVLIFGYYRGQTKSMVISDTDENEKLDRFGDTFLRYQKILGIVFLAAALLHFLVPQALFL